jgi:hypothetical protein
MGKDMADKARIEVFKRGGEWHPYPWMFSVTYRGVRHEFAGIQNRCATKRAAAMRARWRAKWLEDGTFDGRYVTPNTPAQPSAPGAELSETKADRGRGSA